MTKKDVFFKKNIRKPVIWRLFCDKMDDMEITEKRRQR